MNFAFLFANGIYWHMPIMLVLVSLIYSATHSDDWKHIFANAVRSALYIITFMGAVFVVLMFLSKLLPQWM